MKLGESNNILVRRKYKPTKILEGLEEKLGGLEPLDPITSAATECHTINQSINQSTNLDSAPPPPTKYGRRQKQRQK